MILTGLDGYLSVVCASAALGLKHTAARHSIVVTRITARFMTLSTGVPFRWSDSLLPAAGCNAVQAVRRVLHRKEYDVAIGRSFTGMHDIGRNIDHRTGLGFDGVAADGGVEDPLQNINPLFVGMRMRLGAGTSRHTHQADDHAIALDTRAVCGRIIGTAEDVIDTSKIEHVFAGSGALGAGRAGPRWSGCFSHCRTPGRT